MIERHVTFEILPERTGEFEEFFAKEYRPAMAQMPGFIYATLLRDQKEKNRYMMVIRFESDELAAAWRASEVHQSLKPRLSEFHQGTTLTVFDVVV